MMRASVPMTRTTQTDPRDALRSAAADSIAAIMSAIESGDMPGMTREQMSKLAMQAAPEVVRTGMTGTDPLESPVLRSIAEALSAPLNMAMPLEAGARNVKGLSEITGNKLIDALTRRVDVGDMGDEPVSLADVPPEKQARWLGEAFAPQAGLLGGVKGLGKRYGSVLTKAQELEAKGVPMEQIRQETGWHRVPWGEGEKSKQKYEFIHDLGDNVKTKATITPEDIVKVGTVSPKIDYETGKVAFSGKIPQKKEGFVYHVTFNENVDSIMKDGIVPNKKNNWPDWSEKGYSYFSDTPEGAVQWAKDLYEEQIRDFGDVKNFDDFTILQVPKSDVASNLGKWRYEIDDSKAGVLMTKNEFTKANLIDANMIPLDVVFDHPTLYNDYPQLRTLFVRKGSNNTYHADIKTIEITNFDKKTLIHEIQHAIQEHEGFARGGSPEAIASNMQKEIGALGSWVEHHESMMQKYGAEKWEKMSGVTVKELASEKARLDGLMDMSIEHKASNKGYTNQAGEYEARKSSERMPLTASERTTRDPWATGEVIAPEDLIVRMKGGGASASEGKVIATPSFTWNVSGKSEQYYRVRGGAHDGSDLTRAQIEKLGIEIVESPTKPTKGGQARLPRGGQR